MPQEGDAGASSGLPLQLGESNGRRKGHAVLPAATARHYIFRLQAANTADLRLRDNTPEARIVSAAHSKAT
jgi:hypothetical protein